MNLAAPKVEAMHAGCVGCLAREQASTAEEATLTMLAMVLGGHDPHELERDLCFRHRRDVRDAAAAVGKILGDSA